MRRRLQVRFTTNEEEECVVGELAQEDSTIFFEWDPEFVARGVELSPFKTPLDSPVREYHGTPQQPLPGLFDSSLPDGWGLLLMDRHFRLREIDPRSVPVLDRLAYLGRRTMGALTYHPFEDAVEPEAIDLAQLGAHAEEVLAGDAAEVLPQLLVAGGSPGGARPKVLVGVQGNRVVAGSDSLPADHEPWLVKFSARSEAEFAGPLEYAYSLMARAAGLHMPPTRLFSVTHEGRERHYFGVRRFDRHLGNRVHVQTLANLVEHNFRIPNLEYRYLLRWTHILTSNHQDVLALARQMVFNVAAHVRDDHSKNFSFLIDEDDQWRLAPSYDLTDSPGINGYHTTAVGKAGRDPSLENCREVALTASVRRPEFDAIVEQVNGAVSRWSEFADQARCPAAARDETATRLRTL